MPKVILQIPTSLKLRDAAEQTATEYGFSSLQEILRVFMKKLADRSVTIAIEDVIPLSAVSEKRYRQIDADIKKGKATYHAKNVKNLMKQLHGNRLP